MEFEIIKIDENELKNIDITEFEIKDIEIQNDNEYINLCELLKKVKGKTKEIEEFFKEPKAKAYKAHKEITKLEKDYLKKLADFEKLAKKRISEYQLELEQQNTIENPVTIPKVAGVSASDKYKWEVIDEKLIPREYLTVNEKLVNAIIKSTNGTIKIPGIKVIKEKSIRVKGE